jgi:predicted MFS family arabinose efflux permease
MLARPVASLVADASSWHVVFGGAAVAIVVLAAVLRRKLPERVPASPVPYRKLMASLWQLFLTQPVLRRRAAYHAGLFGAFSLFWTVAPLMLATPAFHLSQTGVAVFALVGMAGAIASPIAGKLADSGHTLMATAAALVLGIASFLLPLFAPESAAMLDMGVAANLVLGQRAIFSLGAEVRSRLNGLYFALFFAGGALGSALGGWVYASYGWHAALLAGAAFPGLALLYWMSEYLASRSSAQEIHYTM